MLTLRLPRPLTHRSQPSQAPARASRGVVVPEPEPLNDFERARLENIRRNQEALAGTRALDVWPAPHPARALLTPTPTHVSQPSWVACRLFRRRSTRLCPQ